MMRDSRDRSARPPLRDASLAEEAVAWFVRINSDAATGADRAAFRRWLEDDPAHRMAYAEAEALWRDLGTIPDLRAGRAGGSRRHSVPWYRAAAAGILLAAALGLWGSDIATDLRADHATGVGESEAVALADGSRIRLDTDTALAVDFDAGRRRIRLLRGAAFFDVAADPDRPFEVRAGDGIARALGTRFEVRSLDDSVTVVVEEGRVHVLGRERDKPASGGVTLRAGEAVRYGAGGIDRQRVDPAEIAAWREGKLVFADRPLGAVVAELDRYRPGIIVVLDSALADARFSGVLALGDTDRALAAIARTLPVEIVHLTRYVTLLRMREG